MASHKTWCEQLLLDEAGTVGMKEALLQILLRITDGAEADVFFKDLCSEGKHAQSVCNKTWKRGSMLAYRCLVCEIDPTSAICPDCFRAGSHANHEYRIVQSAGCCDCGDETAWRRSGFCPAHGCALGPDGSKVYEPRLPADTAALLRDTLDVVFERLARDCVIALHWHTDDSHDEEPAHVPAASDRGVGAAAGAGGTAGGGAAGATVAACGALFGALARRPGGFRPSSPIMSRTEAARPLLYASRHNELPEVKRALGNGISPDAADTQHHCRPTALHWAAQFGFLQVAKALLKGGASVHSLNAYRQTPLQVAAFEGHLPLIKLLLSHGADPLHCDMIYGSALFIAEHETSHNRAKAAAMLRAAVEANGASAQAGDREAEGHHTAEPQPAEHEAASAAPDVSTTAAGRARAGPSAGSSTVHPTPSSSRAPYGPSSGPAALQMVRGMLSWLSALCAHGDSIREAAAAVASSPPLLRLCLSLRVACDRPKGLPGGIPGVSVAQPLLELDDLCQSLLLFDAFRARLLDETLRLYDRHIGLTPPPTGEEAAAWRAQPSGEGTESASDAAIGEGGVLAAAAASGTGATAAAAAGATSWAARHPAADPTSAMCSLGKSTFLETFSTRLFTGRAHASPEVVDRAVPTLLHALRGLLRLTLVPAGVGCLLPAPASLRERADVLTVDAREFTGGMVVKRVLQAGLGFVDPMVVLLPPPEDGRGGDAGEEVVYARISPGEDDAFDEWLNAPLSSLVDLEAGDLENALFRVDEMATLPAAVRAFTAAAASPGTRAHGGPPKASRQRYFRIEHRSLDWEGVPGEDPRHGVETVDGVSTRTASSVGYSYSTNALLAAAQPGGHAEAPAGAGAAVAGEGAAAAAAGSSAPAPLSLLTTPEMVEAVADGRLGFVCSKHQVLSSRGYAQTLTNLQHLLFHRDNAIQFLTGAGTELAPSIEHAPPSATTTQALNGSRGGFSGAGTSGVARATADPVSGGRYLSEWLSTLGWVQHMSSIAREERDPDAAPREDSDDPAAHAWVHAFCLSVQVSSLMPSLLAPLVDSCGPATSAPTGASQATTPAIRMSEDISSPPADSVVRDCAALAWHSLLRWLSTVNTASLSTPPTGSAALPTPPPPDSLLPLWPPSGDPRGPPLISHHLPLHRTVAHFLYAGISRGLDPLALLPGLDPAAAAAALEHPLRLQLLSLQLRLRGWSGSRRDPWAADQFYRGRLHREGGWARDMLLIQVCACVLGPEAFLRRLRARLPGALAGDGATSGAAAVVLTGGATSSVAAAAGTPVWGDDACRSALEEVLWLVLTLFKDWAAHGEPALRRDVIHQLALGPMPHSVLCKRLEKRWAEHPKLAPLLAEVGRRAASAAGGRYSLRTPAWWEVDPTYPYYTADERKHVTQRLLALPGGPALASPAPASGGLAPPASPGGGEARPSVPRLGVSAAALRYVPQLGSILLSAPLLSLTARALGAATSGVSGTEPLLSHALHLLLHGIELAVPAGGARQPAGAGESAGYLALLCDENRFTAELAGAAAGASDQPPAAPPAAVEASPNAPASPAVAGCGTTGQQSCAGVASAGGASGGVPAPVGASVISHLVRLTLSSSVSAACKAAADRALQLACSASVACGRARDAASGAFARQARQSHTPGPAAAGRDARRKQARAGRERMMERMAAAQAAFAGSGGAASGAASGEGASGELTPHSRSHAEDRERVRRGLGSLLSDEDASCVLCKERLAGEEGAPGAWPPLACGLIARVCAQRLPVPPDTRSRREGVISALAQAARDSKEPGTLGPAGSAAAVAAATAAPGSDAAEPPGKPSSSAGRKRPREGGGVRAGGSGPQMSAAAFEMAAQLTSMASEHMRNFSSRAEREGRAGGDARPSGTPPSRPGRAAAAAAARRLRLLDTDEARMLLEAGVSPEEIWAGMGANDEGGGAEGEEMEVEESGGEEGEGEGEGEGEEEEEGESSGDGEEDGEMEPSSRELRRQRRVRRAMEDQMGRVIELFMERHGRGVVTTPDGEMDTAEIARLARGHAADRTRRSEGEEGEGEEDGEEEEDGGGDDEGMEGDDDGMSEEDDGLGFGPDLLRESETELLQLLHGEVDDGGLAVGGATIDSHLTMLMNEGESDFGSDSEDEDDLGTEGGGDGPFSDAHVGGVMREEPPAPRTLRVVCGWPLPALQGGADASQSPDLRLEGSLLSCSSPGALMSTCGHAAHVKCWHEYMSGLLRRVMQSEGFEGEGLVKPQRGEFVCPVCRRAANALLPLAPIEPQLPDPLPPQKGKGRAGGAERAREWARELSGRRREQPPADERATTDELRAAMEHFAITCTTVHGALPRLSATPYDPRVRLMPVALLAHNAAVAELSCRLPTGPTPSEAAATSVKLHVLWRLARCAQPRIATTTAALLAMAADVHAPAGKGGPSSTPSSSRPAGGGKAAAESPSSEPPTHAPVSALMCVEPFTLFVDLLVSAGTSHLPLAAAHALALGMAQAVVAMATAAAAGVTTDPQDTDAPATAFATQLSLLRGQLEAVGNNGGRRNAQPSAMDIVSMLCAELLWRMRYLAAALSPTALRTPADGQSAPAAAAATGGQPSAGVPPSSTDARRAASECLAAIGLPTPDDIRTLITPLALHLLDTARTHSAALWQNGAAAVAAAGRASFAAAARGAPSVRRLLATVTGPPPLPPPRVTLVDLPSSFEALFHQVARKRCASCHATPDSRAICLACAAHLCGLDTPHGARAIMSHAASCGVGTGLFLLTNNSAAVLVRERRLVFAGSPYRDAHGEVDIGLVRGKPLTLDPGEYAMLSKQWINLAFDETARNEDEQLPMGL